MILDELRAEAQQKIDTDAVFRRVLTDMTRHEVREINRVVGSGRKLVVEYQSLDYVKVLQEYIDAKLWLHRIERDYFKERYGTVVPTRSQYNRALNLVADLKRKKREIETNQ